MHVMRPQPLTMQKSSKITILHEFLHRQEEHVFLCWNTEEENTVDDWWHGIETSFCALLGANFCYVSNVSTLQLMFQNYIQNHSIGSRKSSETAHDGSRLQFGLSNFSNSPRILHRASKKRIFTVPSIAYPETPEKEAEYIHQNTRSSSINAFGSFRGLKQWTRPDA